MLAKNLWLEKVRTLRGELGFDREIEIDGGDAPHTARDCKAAGASVLVAGSAIFKHKDRKRAVKAIREA